MELKICDPACGSGAFLNQALDFLIKEHNYIDELKAKILGGGIVFSDIENTILENNIYGVDLNEESVEIAKLSLWLRTAQPRRKLNDLSSTIKCGNSLISDKKVAGHKAFHWQESFPKVFTEKDKKAFHITTAIHDSRTSQRMVDYKVRQKRAMGTKPFAAPQYLTAAEEQIITETLAEIVIADKLNIMAYNICKDHLHLLLVCAADEVSPIMQKVKSMTAKMANRHRTSGHDSSAKNTHTTMGHDPLAKPHSVKKHTPLWTQKYGCKEITSEEQLSNTYNYIRHNRSKHELPEHPGKVKALIESFCTDQKTAFATEYQGGFDVVIGNPPYVRQELITVIKPYLEKEYKVYTSSQDLFAYFYEKAFDILKTNGAFGFISNTFDKTKAAFNLREYLTEAIVIEKYIDFTQVQIFEGATTYPVIITARNCKPRVKELFEYVVIPKKLSGKVIDVESLDGIKVTQNGLNSDSWSFNPQGLFDLIERIKTEFSNKPKKSYRGIVTGYNDAFIIDFKIKQELITKHISSAEIIKPFLEGRDLSKWNNTDANKFLIFTRRGINIEEYPAIKDYLTQFKERLTPRNTPEIKVGRKKGSYKWFEIQDSVDYFEKFETSKIVWPNLQSSNKFSLDQKDYYINAPSVILPNASRAVLCVLNSKLVWEFLKSICVVRSGGYIEVKPQYFEQIPIPEIKDEELFNKVVSSVISLVDELQSFDKKFQTYFSTSSSIQKLSKKLQNWHELEFGDFIKELSKARKKAAAAATRGFIPLSKKEEFQWLDLFEENKKKAQDLQAQINQTEQEIDQMVYALYGLTAEEIAIVEQG